MHTPNTIPAPSEDRDSEDALKVLGRVADAFDNPSQHKIDKEPKLFMVHVVQSRHLLTSVPSEESVCQDATHGSYDSSFDITYDEDAELVELGDVSIWEHAGSYPHAPRRSRSHKQRSGSERTVHQDEGVYDVTKMLLTSSPLDRLDRLARMELRKTGWIERVDKWTLVEMGLQGVPQHPITPPKTPSKKAGFYTGECSSLTMTVSLDDGKQAPDTMGRDGCETPEGSQGEIKTTTPASMRSRVHAHCQDSPLTLADFSTLSYTEGSKLARMEGKSRPSRTLLHPLGAREQQTRGRLGRVVRSIVKKMLPPSSVTRHCDFPSTRSTETPRSEVSAESAWTSGSASSWMEAREQGCLDYQTSNRWSGFWH